MADIVWEGRDGAGSPISGSLSIPAEPSLIAGLGYHPVFEDHFDDGQLGPPWGTRMPWAPPLPNDLVIECASSKQLLIVTNQSYNFGRVNVHTLGQYRDQAPHYPDALTFTRGNGLYVEARISFIDSVWGWPALWLYGAEQAQVFPDSICPQLQGEWDIMDHVNPTSQKQNFFSTGVHSNTNSTCGVEDDVDLIHVNMGQNMSGFHTYAGLWTPDGLMRSYVDGVQRAVFTQPEGGGLDQPMFLLISAAKAPQQWPNPMPADLWTLVDYVKVWAK